MRSHTSLFLKSLHFAIFLSFTLQDPLSSSLPAQSAQEVLSPSQTPHSSSTEDPFGVPAQSAQEVLSPSQTPHSSITADPFGVPAQSAQEELSPLQTPHSSITADPPGVPAQSGGGQVQSRPS